MTVNKLIELTNNISKLNSEIDNINNILSALKIDKQLILYANKPIKPDISCKIQYDSNGLIVKGSDLSIDDIPQLSIEKIDGLNELMNNINEKINDLYDKFNSIPYNKKIKPGIGLKVNYDENGLITSSIDTLSVVDIPQLPIEKIDGLNELIKSINNNDNTDDHNVNPGTYTKITYDRNGKVVDGSNLTMNDLPMDLIIKLNKIMDIISNVPMNENIKVLSDNINNKINSIGPINPGTYTKLEVNKDGLVVSGSKLNVDDLPAIINEKINNINNTLKTKALQKDLVELTNTVSSLLSNKSVDIINLENNIKNKVCEKDFYELKNKVDKISNQLDNIINSSPTNLIIEDIKNNLNILSEKISNLEK